MRAFFALWPNDAERVALHAQAIETATDAQGRPVAIDKLHITLVFLGDVDNRTIARLTTDAARLGEGRVNLAMTRIGSWRKAGIAWLAPGGMPRALADLQESLAALARNCGVQLQGRPYFPHLTLVRGAGVAMAEANCPQILLRFRGYCLIRSDLASGRYEMIGRWPGDPDPG